LNFVSTGEVVLLPQMAQETDCMVAVSGLSLRAPVVGVRRARAGRGHADDRILAHRRPDAVSRKLNHVSCCGHLSALQPRAARVPLVAEDGANNVELLVSLCNLSRAGATALVRIDTANGRIDPVPLGDPPDTIRGCTGIALDAQHVYCLWIIDAERSFVSVLERSTLTPVDVLALPDVRDPHSIAVSDGWIYVAATGTDEVRRLEKARLGQPSEVVWRASAEGCDTHHVNSLVVIDRRILCSAFGPKASDRWSTALDGYVADTSTGEILWKGIEQPHSLTQGLDDLYVAESRRARVRGLHTCRTLQVDGYARGLAFGSDGRMVAGSSPGRARSRSLGTIENPADAGELSGLLGLSIADGDAGAFQEEATIDLSAFQAEIYDVVLLTT
jgi:hypothetical protein